MTPWLRFLTIALKHSLLVTLRSNTSITLQKPSNTTFVTDSRALSLTLDALKRKNFAISTLLRQIWHSHKKFNISKNLRKELKLLNYVFTHPKQFKFESPISHIIPRDFDFTASGDACLDGGCQRSISIFVTS